MAERRKKKETVEQEELMDDNLGNLAEGALEIPADEDDSESEDSNTDIEAQLKRIMEHLGFLEKKIDQLLEESKNRKSTAPSFRGGEFSQNRPYHQGHRPPYQKHFGHGGGHDRHSGGSGGYGMHRRPHHGGGHGRPHHGPSRHHGSGMGGSHHFSQPTNFNQ